MVSRYQSVGEETSFLCPGKSNKLSSDYIQEFMIIHHFGKIERKL